MSRKIGLIGDPHATPEPLADALALLRQENVDEIWCTGDLAGYGMDLDKTVALLKASCCRSIYGNHEQWHLEKAGPQSATATEDYFKSLPPVIHEEREGISLYMVHGSPPQFLIKGIRLLDEHGIVIEEARKAWTEELTRCAFDVLIIGHTHQVYAEQLGNTLVINPGSTRFNHCCGVLSLPRKTVEWFPLSGHVIRYTWNWGDEYKK